MKSILISIRPEWVAKILNGEKTIEVRKSAPKCDLPIVVYIYCTKGDYIGRISNKYVGKVVAKFTLRKVEDLRGINSSEGFSILDRACLDYDEFLDYLLQGREGAYAWHISDLQIFDKPKDLSEFGLAKAPESWQYVEEE